ncbi:CoA pyrophosphatase [Lacinutrix sp. 5H-3-7-4]|uniref:NUDIX hydrolase n=1 Tax=Lacinutrix sp. (strain 5H-3-7-4) TaxID=983544 RepID=UPI00020A34B7|nr:CoA pyrophosphatase [Lacinutrix sp. 5H-3-7-4]AEH01783.1 NUDIX hydrolase [Lacinutrix sp. 5H-3-7-4]
MNFNKFKESIVKIENLPLPGQDSQFKMSPPFREALIKLQAEKIKRARKSAVMALFYPNLDNETELMLILRKTYKGVHSAQVGFPGGKLEANETTKEAALRETEEEIGVDASSITVLKKLTEVYIPPSNFHVQPYIGIVKNTPIFTKQDTEVEDLLEVKLTHFLDENNITEKEVTTYNGLKVNVPAYNLNSHLVWGATAMMLSEVKDLLKCTIK